MKKLLAFILAMVLCFSLCACGGNKDTESIEDRVKQSVKNRLNFMVSLDDKWKAVNNVTCIINKKSENTFEVTGKISIRDKYGDLYTGKYDASVEYDASTDTFKTNCNIGTLTKNN